MASERFDAIIALGAVIRGSTPHFDFVAGECAKGLGVVGLESGLPVINGVLTTDSIEQAIERSGTKKQVIKAAKLLLLQLKWLTFVKGYLTLCRKHCKATYAAKRKTRRFAVQGI